MRSIVSVIGSASHRLPKIIAKNPTLVVDPSHIEIPAAFSKKKKINMKGNLMANLDIKFFYFDVTFATDRQNYEDLPTYYKPMLFYF